MMSSSAFKLSSPRASTSEKGRLSNVNSMSEPAVDGNGVLGSWGTVDTEERRRLPMSFSSETPQQCSSEHNNNTKQPNQQQHKRRQVANQDKISTQSVQQAPPRPRFSSHVTRDKHHNCMLRHNDTASRASVP